jgi:hypothetical protein
MLWLSEVLLQHHDITSFSELERVVREKGQSGEMFFRMDVRPPYQDTPEEWESRLEAAFHSTGAR